MVVKRILTSFLSTSIVLEKKGNVKFTTQSVRHSMNVMLLKISEGGLKFLK